MKHDKSRYIWHKSTKPSGKKNENESKIFMNTNHIKLYLKHDIKHY